MVSVDGAKIGKLVVNGALIPLVLVVTPMPERIPILGANQRANLTLAILGIRMKRRMRMTVGVHLLQLVKTRKARQSQLRTN